MARKLLPLSEKEKKMAELNHDKILLFLRKHNYPIEEFYDIAVMGYLEAIQDYNRNIKIQEKYTLSAVCERAMLSSITDNFKYENRKKRKPSGGLVSIDTTLEDSKESFINSIITPTLEDDFFEEWDRQQKRERVREILYTLTDIQRKIVILKANGKTHDDIEKILNISKYEIFKELQKMRNKIRPKQAIENITEEVVSLIKLTPKQLEVARLLIQGYKTSEISKVLQISWQSANGTINRIRQKAINII